MIYVFLKTQLFSLISGFVFIRPPTCFPPDTLFQIYFKRKKNKWIFPRDSGYKSIYDHMAFTDRSGRAWNIAPHGRGKRKRDNESNRYVMKNSHIQCTMFSLLLGKIRNVEIKIWKSFYNPFFPLLFFRERRQFRHPVFEPFFFVFIQGSLMFYKTEKWDRPNDIIIALLYRWNFIWLKTSIFCIHFFLIPRNYRLGVRRKNLGFRVIRFFACKKEIPFSLRTMLF